KSPTSKWLSGGHHHVFPAGQRADLSRAFKPLLPLILRLEGASGVAHELKAIYRSASALPTRLSNYKVISRPSSIVPIAERRLRNSEDPFVRSVTAVNGQGRLTCLRHSAHSHAVLWTGRTINPLRTSAIIGSLGRSPT